MVNESHASVFLRANNSQGHNFAPTAYNMTNTTATYIAALFNFIIAINAIMYLRKRTIQL